MKEHKIKILTKIRMRRLCLITKEKMESIAGEYCRGEKGLKDSVNDDLESLFENIRLGKELKSTHCSVLIFSRN